MYIYIHMHIHNMYIYVYIYISVFFYLFVCLLMYLFMMLRGLFVAYQKTFSLKECRFVGYVSPSSLVNMRIMYT